MCGHSFNIIFIALTKNRWKEYKSCNCRKASRCCEWCRIHWKIKYNLAIFVRQILLSLSSDDWRVTSRRILPARCQLAHSWYFRYKVRITQKYEEKMPLLIFGWRIEWKINFINTSFFNHLRFSGSFQFPAMESLSISTSNGFILVFSVDSEESWREVVRLREKVRSRLYIKKILGLYIEWRKFFIKMKVFPEIFLSIRILKLLKLFFKSDIN